MEQKKSAASRREITLEMLQASFHLPIIDASRAFEVCTTRLKKVCRQHGIKRWPHRQVIVGVCVPPLVPCSTPSLPTDPKRAQE